jgi:replicative DNA helicase
MAERLPVVYLSLEMTEEQVTQRITAMLSGVSLSRITNPSTMSKLNWQAVSAVAADVEAMPFHIVYQPTMLIDEAMNTARMYHNRHGKLGCIVLDYLQFMRSDSNTTRNEEVSKYSVRMKQLAGDLGTTSIVVSQLNRQSGGGAPELSHLRDSGSIEQDADVVMMIEKPCLDDDDGYGSREMVVHVRKNRQGETGTADLTFLPNLMRWK